MTSPVSTGSGFDEIIHAPNRLQICAMLAPVDAVAFAAVRDELGVTDPVLSKHVKVLQSAGYVIMTRATSQGRSRSWLRLTAAGHVALDGHLAELRRIAQRAGSVG